ncbi:ABC transporter substrate-binding protein [Mesorhizobium sp. M0955]|uniref:ABC transporter substrate-binding protein n=1 Tax=Mesorhizobium sp. M0955 TaxID=2957033 RepID=UPI0033369EA0
MLRPETGVGEKNSNHRGIRMQLNERKISRRGLISAASVLLAAPYIIRAGRAFAQGGEISFVTWGGAYKEAVQKAVIEPFTAETGIKVNVIDTPDLAKVKAQVTSGNVDWDVFDAPSALGASGSKEGYWEPLDPALFDADDLALPADRDRVPFYTFAGGIAWDPAKFPEGKHPTTFAEYFDYKKFPGRRTFRDRPSETLEAALLADGVSPSELYPLDVDRAFKKLDTIKPYVASWVAATPQTVTLLQTGEVDFSYTYSARVKATQASDKTLSFSFAEALIGTEYLAVVKGAPHKENAFKFVSYALRPEAQAPLMEQLGYNPNSKKSLRMLSDSARKWLPDSNNPRNVILNDNWWADNFETISRRFKEWILT